MVKIGITALSSVIIIAHPWRSAWFQFTIGNKKFKTLIHVLPYEEFQNKIVVEDEDPTELDVGPTYLQRCLLEVASGALASGVAF